MDWPKLPDYSKWKAANKDFNLYAYVHAIVKEKQLSSDFLIACRQLFWPDFLFENGLILIKENFSKEKYDKLVDQGLKREEIEYWMNLLSLDGFFQDEEDIFSVCQYLGNQLVPLWTAKLSLEFPGKQFVVECIVDRDQEEVYMVLKQS